VLLRCLCGYLKVVATSLESIVIRHGTPSGDVKLPRKESNLWFTLMVAASLEEASSAEIAHRLVDLGKEFSVSDVASYLTIMRSKGLVETTEVRRGIPGGSSWQITDPCAALLNLEE
jgi:hypothetical protein